MENKQIILKTDIHSQNYYDLEILKWLTVTCDVSYIVGQYVKVRVWGNVGTNHRDIEYNATVKDCRIVKKVTNSCYLLRVKISDAKDVVWV